MSKNDSTPTAGKNSNLSVAKSAKNDEFYTQWVDIEREMNAYIERDPDVFRDKVVLLPCDDPEWSNFAKFFALHFTDYGLKKLISTSYAPNSKPKNVEYQPSPFEIKADQFDEKLTRSNGKLFVLERKDINGDGVVNIDDLQWSYLEGDGDFRSAEVTALRDEADIVVTNPPFSLFREFVSWLIEGGVKFSIIGNKNAITYKEMFPLIKANQLWVGKAPMGTDFLFDVPASSAKGLREKSREGSAWREVDGKVMGRASGVWFTNIEHGRRHDELTLMTQEDNVRFNKKLKGKTYFRYDNYEAIEVPYTDAIPSDYTGAMGVPISFLDKYNPDQFEILGVSNTGGLPDSLLKPGQAKYDRPYVNGKRLYSRILIKHRTKSTTDRIQKA